MQRTVNMEGRGAARVKCETFTQQHSIMGESLSTVRRSIMQIKTGKGVHGGLWCGMTTIEIVDGRPPVPLDNPVMIARQEDETLNRFRVRAIFAFGRYAEQQWQKTNRVHAAKARERNLAAARHVNRELARSSRFAQSSEDVEVLTDE